MQDQIIRRICDNTGCTETQDFSVTEMQSGRLSTGKAANLAHWVSLAREYYTNGQPQPVIKNACSDKCAKEIIEKNLLAAPVYRVSPRDGGVDIEELRKAGGHEV